MKTWRFRGLYQQDGWLEPAYVQTDAHGCIQAISATGDDRKVSEHVDGWVLPGLTNAHSHAFQYAMAGLAEYRSSANSSVSDDFWSWREGMYRLALQVTPEQTQALATHLYSEMLKQGYTSVVEFLYLQKDPRGHFYQQKSEMALRHVQAAHDAGIDITVVPVFYQTSNFDKPARPEQIRFCFTDADEFLKYHAELAAQISKYPQAQLGIGVHSLRAAPAATLRDILAHGLANRPFHLHISEQEKEVQDCLSAWGARPVDWLLDHAPVNENFHLVHATHTTTQELQRLAQTKANVVLCPTSEANLGDGFFALTTWQGLNGRWCIGSDSHVSRNPWEELRLLDYGVRLRQERRNPLCLKIGDDSAAALFDPVLHNGRSASGKNVQKNYFCVGQALDAVVVAHSLWEEKVESNRRLGRWLFAEPTITALGTLVHGQWKIRDHRHPQQELIDQHLKMALENLL